MAERTDMRIRILLISAVFIYSTDGQCEKNRFGVGCRFECHCKQNQPCDAFTGKCPNECDKYWAGPSCQYRNIAVDALTEDLNGMSNPPHSIGVAIDENYATCTDVNSTRTRSSNPWWRMWLPKNHTIKELDILTTDNMKDQFSDLKVLVEYVPKQYAELSHVAFIKPQQEVCYENKNKKISDKRINVVCKKPLRGNQIKIQLGNPNSWLVICDLKIFEGRNVAFGRRASQSSQNSEGLSASVVVDGNITDSAKNECFITENERSPWWSVDLAHIMAIDRILITSLKSDNFLGYQIFASNDSLAWMQIYSDEASHNLDITVSTKARFIKIAFEKQTKQLILCEVQVFGDCLPDICGYDCADACHCKNYNSEIKMSGNCTFGCQDKWTGDSKKCDKALFCTETSDIQLPVVAIIFIAVGSVVLPVASVLITICVMKKRQTSNEQTSNQKKSGRLSKLKDGVLSIYYNNTNLKVRKTKLNPNEGELPRYDDLELSSKEDGTSEGYSQLDEKKGTLKFIKGKLGMK